MIYSLSVYVLLLMSDLMRSVSDMFSFILKSSFRLGYTGPENTEYMCPVHTLALIILGGADFCWACTWRIPMGPLPLAPAPLQLREGNQSQGRTGLVLPPEVLSELYLTLSRRASLTRNNNIWVGGSSKIDVEHWVYCVPHSKLAS